MNSEEFRKYIANKHTDKSGTRTNDVTKSILNYLNSNGYVVWRSNTLGIFDVKIFAQKLKELQSVTVSNAVAMAKVSYRKCYVLNGTTDILGSHRETVRFIGVEIKTGKDKMSIFQIAFQQEVAKTGAVYIVAGDIQDVMDYFKKHVE